MKYGYQESYSFRVVVAAIALLLGMILLGMITLTRCEEKRTTTPHVFDRELEGSEVVE